MPEKAAGMLTATYETDSFSDIQPEFHLFLGLRLEVLHLNRVDGRQLLQGLHAEIPQEFLRGTKKNGPPRSVQPPKSPGSDCTRSAY